MQLSQSPKVSVLITTYNHASYIAQAVTSALNQKTDFPVEVIVGEDCSTDGTRDILLDLQKRHGPKLKLLLHERNLGGPQNVRSVLAACRGQYVAMLEGDDYWTSPHKLHRQVRALDSHPEWALCFHPARMVYQDASRPPQTFPHNWSKPVATVDDLFQNNFICTCSVLFRNRLFELPAWHSEIVPGDWAIHILNADRGLIGYLPQVMADYRIHAAGLWSGITQDKRNAEVLRLMSRLDRHFAGKYSRQIDEHRINLVVSLTQRVDELKARITALEQLPPALRRRLAKPPARSSVYLAGRTLLRPLERFGRRVGEMMGIRKRAA
jgi:glycosyltransferase involved in cell wall biosynthesis